MCQKCVVADEYTESLRDQKMFEELRDWALRVEYFAKGGTITYCPPFTPGGLRVYSIDERPERSINATPKGFKVSLGGKECND